MRKIKVVGALLFTVALILALLSYQISKENQKNLRDLTSLNEQKAFTQEVSKSIFYSYRNQKESSEELERATATFVSKNHTELANGSHISQRWNQFYADVSQFRKTERVKTAYNSIITEKLVNRIYHNSVMLVNELNRLIELKESRSTQYIKKYKRVQHTLFLILISLLIYLFTEIRSIIKFIQKFSKTSKKIIENSTIQGVKPIVVERSDRALKEATDNYNYLVEKINRSLSYSSQSMRQTTQSLEEVAENIEDFMELLSTMQEGESEALFEREDAVIDSLETIMTLRKKLKYLEKDVKELMENKRE